MHLGDRRGGNGNVVEDLKQMGDWATEFLFDQRLCLVRRERREFVLQKRQILGDFIAE